VIDHWEATMKCITLALAFCLISLRAFAEMAAAPQFDCTPICGSPTCCIAQSQAIPACSVTASNSLSQLERLAKQSKSSEIVNICVGATKTKGVNPIVDKSQAEALRKLSCHWGCCSRSQVLTSLKANPRLGEKMFAGTTLAALGRQVSQKGAVTPDIETRIDSELTPLRFKVCIFCCTF
jgi:hypothetical protein